MTRTTVSVVVAYARGERQELRCLDVPAGSTLAEAIDASGLLRGYPEIDLARCKVGIFGRLAPLDAPLSEGDRVEIYRPLAADPKDARRRRAVSRKKNA